MNTNQETVGFDSPISHIMKATFTVNLYDSDGDMIDKGVYIHLNDDIILKLMNSDELKALGENFIKMSEEIYENYKY